MAFRKTLARRLFHITKISAPNSSLTHSAIPSSHLFQETLIPPDHAKTSSSKNFRSSSDSSDAGFFRRFLQRRAIVQSAVTSPELRSLSLGDKLAEKLKGINTTRDRLRWEGLNPPMNRSDSQNEISVEDTRKLLRLSQLEMLKTKLRNIPTSCISYSEFTQICSDVCSTSEQGLEFAKVLDQSGDVIVLGNVVFLRPEQVAKVMETAMENIIPLSKANPNDPRKKELEEMETVKSAIDEKAEALVKRELCAGLGFFVIQTAAFMRLTFWELSWDVMEPICYYVSSMYFMAGYAFFMRTSRDPSFEGFYESRFSAKQKRLMKNKNFDLERFNQLRRDLNSLSSQKPSSAPFDHSDSTMLGAALHR